MNKIGLNRDRVVIIIKSIIIYIINTCRATLYVLSCLIKTFIIYAKILASTLRWAKMNELREIIKEKSTCKRTFREFFKEKDVILHPSLVYNFDHFGKLVRFSQICIPVHTITNMIYVLFVSVEVKLCSLLSVLKWYLKHKQQIWFKWRLARHKSDANSSYYHLNNLSMM